MYINDCKKCGKHNSLISQRLSGLENAKYSYENAKGKGTFDKNNPEAVKLIGELAKQKVDIAVAHTKHMVEDISELDNGASRSEPGVPVM